MVRREGGGRMTDCMKHPSTGKELYVVRMKAYRLNNSACLVAADFLSSQYTGDPTLEHQKLYFDELIDDLLDIKKEWDGLGLDPGGVS